MYGTVGRLQVKPGRLGDLTSVIRELEGAPGVRAMSLVGKDGSESIYHWTITWESKEAHDTNGERPGFAGQYARLLDTLDGDPDWASGAIAYMYRAAG